jgi:hypothetical protein
MRRPIILAAAALAAAPAAAATNSTEVAIPFASSNGIHDWQADGNRGLYIKSITGQWYYARTMGVCGRLRTALSLGFETSAGGQLDRHGAILAEGVRCPIKSLVRSDPPPRKKRR